MYEYSAIVTFREKIRKSNDLRTRSINYGTLAADEEAAKAQMRADVLDGCNVVEVISVEITSVEPW